jgi:hypothetical protein
LEKFTVRRQLDFQQVRYLHDFGKLAEILTDTFLFSEGVSHLRSSIMTILMPLFFAIKSQQKMKTAPSTNNASQ